MPDDTNTDDERTTSPFTNGSPPTGHDWGDRTRQAGPSPAPSYWETDAYEIRQCFGIDPFDEGLLTEVLEHPHGRMVYPDWMVHEKDPTVTRSSKGNDGLVVGRRDSGKTTLAKFRALRCMEDHGDLVGEDNAHQVIWRGRSDGSGWLPFKKWTTLWLPAHADVEAHWMNEGDEADATPRETVDDLKEVVREVNRYDDLYDLLDQLGDAPQGTFHVVMPDPTFAGCEEATRRSDRVPGSLPFTPRWEDGEETPIIHWWFAFLLARREYGPFQWMAVIFDEMGDWLPERAEQDEHHLRDKVELLVAIWKALRKRYLSIYGFVQYESDVFHEVRRRFQTRIDMPDGTSNPRNRYRSEIPVGFRDVGMETDVMGDAPVGVGLCYEDGTTDSFSKFSWPDFPDWPEDRSRWLRIRVTAPVTQPAALEEDVDEDDEQGLEYDGSVLEEFQNQWVHQLRILAPGDGVVDVDDPAIEEPLTSPVDGLEFVDDLRDRGDHVELRMTDGDEEIVVARVPTDGEQPDPDASTLGVADD